jgi:hypothetical protein
VRAVFVLPLLAAPAFADGVEEIMTSDGDAEIRLRADGTAEKHYRGRWDRVRLDEPVGHFTAKLEAREFRRLAALPGADKVGEFRARMPAFPARIVRMAVVRGGTEKKAEWGEPISDRDPEPPTELWTLDAAVAGLAARLDWRPVPSGVNVTFGGPGANVREVCVREARSGAPVAVVRTRHAWADLPVRPGAYTVEVSELAGDRWTDARKWDVTIEKDKYLAVEAGK